MQLDQKVGTSLGFIAGFVKTAGENLIFGIDPGITWADVTETVILAGLGATVGFFTTNFLKFLKSWWKGRKAG